MIEIIIIAIIFTWVLLIGLPALIRWFMSL